MYIKTDHKISKILLYMHAKIPLREDVQKNSWP